MKRIAIHSAPRSGSTWLGSIFDSSPEVAYKYQPLFSYALKSFLSENSDIIRIDNFFERLTLIEDDFIDQKESKEKGIIPKFIKGDITSIVYKEVRYHHIINNLLCKDDGIKIIGLVRNPLSVLSSWYSAPREFRKDLGWNYDEEWRHAQSKNQNRIEEFYGFEKWREVTLLFEKLKREFPERFYLLKYSDLLNSTNSVVKEIFNFCDIKLTDQTLEFISNSKSKNLDDPYSVYKNKKLDDNWKTILPKNIIDTVLEELDSTLLEQYLE
jgi:hypothetical protein